MSPSDTPNTPRAVIVTGGNSGIGRAIAAAFIARGDRVHLVGRTEATLRETAEALGPRACWHAADVGRREQVASAVAAILRETPEIDVLVNAAGSSGESVTTAISLEEAERAWDDAQAVNLKGPLLMCVAVGPHLRRPGGRIILLSSIAAFTGGSRAGSAAYAAAKAGVLGLTRGFARELSPQGITVNAIAPGLVAGTGFFGGPLPEERLRGIVSQTPAGRPGRPEDVAAAALYLASPEASFVTGEVLNVNGGWLFGR